MIQILNEDFEMPACNCDLQELIETAINDFQFTPLSRVLHKKYKATLNKLIDEYNERRKMKIYNHV